jgi:hypothetical protein
LLDTLPPDDPGAIAGRRDLRRINAVMGNHRWIARRLGQWNGEGTIVELGAGDGLLAAAVCRQDPSFETRYHAIDYAPRPAGFPTKGTWHACDIWCDEAAAILTQASAVLCSLVLHHFTDDELRRLGALFHHTTLLLASEPCRRQLHLWQGRIIFPVIHKVTRHDMMVSIRAGFRTTELAEAMGFTAPEWRVEEEETFFGACRLAATRHL